MKQNILLVALLGTIASAACAQDATYDARSLGMGGAGVASANSLNAIYQNPATLAALPNEKFAFEIPIISIRLLDADNLQKDIDPLNQNANALSNALTTFQNQLTAYQNAVAVNPAASTAALQTSAVAAGNAINNFDGSLNTVNNKSLGGSLFGGTMIAAPRSSFSFALMLDAHAEFGAKFNYDPNDSGIVTGLATAMITCGNAVGTQAQIAAACQTAGNGVGAGGKITLGPNSTTGMSIRGAMMKEVGISVARHIDNWSDLDVGITPKFIQLTSYDYVADAQSGNSKVTLSSGEKKDSLFTIDLGAAKTFDLNKDSAVKTGLVVKNVLPKTATTVNGNEIRIAPQLTAGVAYTRSWFTGTADLDVLKNKAMLQGFSNDSQYLRLGTELNAWGFAQFRLGYRHDLAGNYPDLPSVGVGLFHVFDLSVAAVGKKEAAAALQFGIRF